MKNFFIFGILIILLSCDSSVSVKDKETRIWKPIPIAYINDCQVKLFWFNNSILNEILLPYDWVTPDKFEIFISTDNQNFNKLTELNNDNKFNYTIENLQNGNSYYFYIISKKNGYEQLISDTIMAVPNIRTQFEKLLSFDHQNTVLSVSFAKTLNKIAYVNHNYRWDGGQNCCMAIAVMISNYDGSEPELVGTISRDPQWSSKNEKLVYSTQKGEKNEGQGIPSQIAVYDYMSKKTTKLTNSKSYKYAPVFSKNSELILYHSNENSNINKVNNIWVIDLITLESSQITDVEANNLTNAGFPNWFDNDNFLFEGYDENQNCQIYKSSISEKNLNKIFESEWNDYCPSISPNNDMIAFISDRTGYNQVWLYDIKNKTFRQITGFSDEENLMHEWSKIEWFDDFNITFTYGYNKLIKMRIE